MTLCKAVRRITPLSLDLLVLLLASSPALIPLAAPGYLRGPDAVDPPWRSLEILRALSEGVILPRWSGDLVFNYGYPLFNFYSPLSFYPAALLAAIAPIGLLDGSKVTFGVALLLAEIGAYLLGRVTLKHRGAAVLAGVLYLYAPKTIEDVYQAATLAGMASLAVLPYALAAFVRVWERPTILASGATAITLAALILTHNVTAAMGLGMMAAYAVFRFLLVRDLKGLPLTALGMGLGIGMAAFYLIPSIGELHFTHIEQVTADWFDFRAHFVDPLGNVPGRYGNTSVYFMTKWGPFDLHPAYPYGSPPFKLGLIQGLLLLLTAAVLIRSRKRPAAVVSLFLVTLLLFFGHTTWSRWIWETIPGASLMQFPWRLLGPLGLSLAVTSSWALFWVADRWHGFVWLMPLVGLAAVLSSMVSAPVTILPFETGPTISPETLFLWQSRAKDRIGTTSYGQFLPIWTDWTDTRLEAAMDRFGETYPEGGWVNMTAYRSPEARAWIVATRRGLQWMEARVEAAEATTIPFRAIYFPGWTAYVDGERVPIEPSPWQEYEEHRAAALGVCLVEVPAGTHEVRLVFEETQLRAISDVVSGVSGFGIGVLLLGGLWRRGGRVISGRGFALVVVGWLGVCGGVYLGDQRLIASRVPEWVGNVVVRDVVVEAEEDRLEVSVPAGAVAEEYVRLKDYSIDGERRRVLYMHPPASATTRVWIPKDARLEFAVALDPEVWEKAGDGVTYLVEVGDGGKQERVYSRYVDPKTRESDRKWIEGEVDLGAFAQRFVELTFRADSGASAEYDWGGWATPRVVIGGTH